MEKLSQNKIRIENPENNKILELREHLKRLKSLRYDWREEITQDEKHADTWKVRKAFFTAINGALDYLAKVFDISFDASIVREFHKNIRERVTTERTQGRNRMTTQQDIYIANQTLDYMIEVIEKYIETSKE